MTYDMKTLIPLIRKTLPTIIAQSIIGVQPMTSSTRSIFTLSHHKDYRVWSKKEYKFSRAKWYIANFDDRYYNEVDEWCEKHFGPHPKQPDAWSRWWHKYESSIHFRDEKDYVFFVLRWGV